ncbi:PREDICTED: magnesium transporter MRS2-F-like [Populus euphratica]|uniref:Magnesium transporter n=1 Tax=Populus euphratica TaxID=75702 RepID=A0AAJ6U3Y9_POPEU|nr:PREDICTED: magnesium transporter MRS2-F-like [Populus euphratica]
MASKLKKGMIGVKAWLVISESGQSFVDEVGKHSIMKRTGLPARDLRALDPVLSYPSSILGRERAIVVNLEHIRAIITATEVLMINSNNPLIVQFVEDLQHRIAFGNANATPPQQAVDHDGTGLGDAADTTSPTYNSGDVKSTEIAGESANSKINDLVAAGPKVLPFEFKALEACLESACRCLESETQTLEEEAYPALDELTSNISTLNLERVRQIKSRLVAISGRVQKVRDELEHLLDDDNDMAEMYLTEKIYAYAADQTSSIEEVYDGEQEVVDESVDDSKSGDDSEIYTGSKPNVEELEMLLEAYFAQIDGTLQKLSHMRDYVDDTEDFINIMLDDKQNQLLQMGVMLGAANMILNAGIVVVGLFGMNIHIELFDGKPIQFLEAVIGACGGCVALFIVALRWGKKKNILAL